MHDAGKVGRGDRCERARATAGKHGRWGGRALAGWLAGRGSMCGGGCEWWDGVGAVQGANGEGTAEELGSERGSELTGQAAEARGAQGQRAAAAIGAASYLINSSTNQLGHWQYQAA
jgi:hypothetical protein